MEKWSTSIYTKLYDFKFHLTNSPFMSSNIPCSPAYGVFITQLIRYARASSSYECFIQRAKRLSSKRLKHGYLAERSKSSFRKFYVRRGYYIQQYEVSISRMLNWLVTVTSQPIRLSTNSVTLIPSFIFIELRVVSMEHLQRLWHASRERIPFRTPGSVPLFGACVCSNCWDQFSWTCRLFSTFHLKYPSELSRFCFWQGICRYKQT